MLNIHSYSRACLISNTKTIVFKTIQLAKRLLKIRRRRRRRRRRIIRAKIVCNSALYFI